MLLKRFSLAKELDAPFKTPRLLRCGNEVRIEGGIYKLLDYELKRELVYPASLAQREIKIADDMYIVPNANFLLRNARDFVDYTIALRKKYGYNAILYIPGVPATLIPVLFYLGYDVFDDCMEKLECHTLWGRAEECYGMDTEHIFELMLGAFQEGRLRELVESIPDNKSQELLRYADRNYYKEIEPFYPIHTESINAVSMNSLYRPDIVRWRRRLYERYVKPEYGENLLLLPCSARKPYSESKSHKLMRRHIKSTMHEVILTSPLGLVPRELESFYPAKNYDIPVIGHWYEEEKKLISEMLEWLLTKYDYDTIISFLPKSMDFLEDILKAHGAEMIWDGDMDKLAKSTKALGTRVSKGEILKQNFQTLSAFQFGTEFDFSSARVVGRYPRVDIKIDNGRLFGYDMHRGMLTLTERSAKALSAAGKYTVYIDDFHPEGDVFAAGVLSATSDIRPGDEVAIVHDGELRAWGTARMAYYDMAAESKGKAVKVRGKL